MRQLHDFKDDEAFEIWIDILEPLTAILSDAKIVDSIKTKPKLKAVQDVLKAHTPEIKEILLRIDNTPITGSNLIIRTMGLLTDVYESEDAKPFLNTAEIERNS